MADRTTKQPWTRHDTLLVAGLVLCAGLFWLLGRYPAGCENLHLEVLLAGEGGTADDALAKCTGVSAWDVRWVLLADTVFAGFYLVVLTAALRRWWARGWRARPFPKLGPYVVMLPVAAAVCDVLENVVLASTIRDASDEMDLHLVDYAAEVLSVLAWCKLGAAGLSVLFVLLTLVGTLGYLKLPLAPSGASGDGRGSGAPDGEGISLSGGGIRAASYALGALQGVDGAGRFRTARFVSAASGGAYTGMAWYVARGTPQEATGVAPAPTERTDGILTATPPAPSLYCFIRENRRYMATGRGGLPAVVLLVVLFFTINLLLLASAVYLLAWPLGRLVSSQAVVDQLVRCDHQTRCDVEIRAALALPALTFAAAGLGALVASLFLAAKWHRRLLTISAAAMAVAAAAAAVLLLVPFAMAEVPAVLRSISGGVLGKEDDPAAGAGFLGILSGLGLTAALARLALKPVRRAASRLGGLLLAVLLLLFAGKVATDAAYRGGRFASPRLFLITAVLFPIAYFLLNQCRWSPHVLYLKRLRSTFATRQGQGSASAFGVEPLAENAEGTWHDYSVRNTTLPHPVPELLVCAAAQRNRGDVTGIPAISFVFSAKEVVMIEDCVGPDGTVRSDRYAVETVRYTPTTDRQLVTPSGAAAMSGAALSSAMGRHSMGSTNALLAALNLRLGVWMPNPRYVHEEGQQFKKPRLGYLFKEIVGRYDLEDPYVYVTDGGHWENLALVELIRRRCKWITCIDGSGDAPGSFATLREAITLARLSCLTDVEIDLAGLAVDASTGLYGDCVAVGVIRYHSAADHPPTRGCTPTECPVGVLLYVKSVVSRFAPHAVQAYAMQDRLFPNYPTGDQFLTTEQFDRLVMLGRTGAERAMERREQLVAALQQPGGASPPDAHLAHVVGCLRQLGFTP